MDRKGLRDSLSALSLVACALVSPTQVTPEAPVRRTLQTPDAILSTPFNRITGLHELPDRRVIVVDGNDQSVMVVDFSNDRILQLGRKGSGPGEYLYPAALLNLGGDSIGIEDGGNRRIVVVNGKTGFGGVLSSVGTRIGAHAQAAMGNRPRTSDNRGRFYSLGNSDSRDSAPIERWIIGSSIRETVAYLPLAPPELRRTLPNEGTRAFVAVADWAVGPDGQIAILHVTPYSVDVIDSKGSRVRGKPIPYERVQVSEQHKRQWREERSRQRPVLITTPKGEVSAGLRALGVQEPVQWPVYMPPFFGSAGQFAPDGRLWIKRLVPAGSEMYDIVDGRGVVVERMSTPARTRIVGFGKAHVYLVRLDPDHQEFLERYRIAYKGSQ